jgi:hypothetical protein
MTPILLLIPLYSLSTKELVFPILPSLDYSSFQPLINQSHLKTCPTVPTGPTNQGALNWTASNKFEPLQIKCTQIKAFLASI